MIICNIYPESGIESLAMSLPKPPKGYGQWTYGFSRSGRDYFVNASAFDERTKGRMLFCFARLGAIPNGLKGRLEVWDGEDKTRKKQLRSLPPYEWHHDRDSEFAPIPKSKKAFTWKEAQL